MPMAKPPKLNRALVLGVCLSLLSFASKGQETSSPQALLKKAIALENKKNLPQYTYFELQLTQNRNLKGKFTLNTTRLYEYTWIGELPYGHLIELDGKPLKGKALAAEEAKYEKALADRIALDNGARAKAEHAYLVDSSLKLEPLLTPRYALSELRQEKLADGKTHVIDCTPTIATREPAATRHVTLWITDAGVILRHAYELIGDEADKMHGSHGQQDYQLIDGNRLPQHKVFHLNAPNGYTGDFEDTYTRFRRFNASVRILPGTSTPAESAENP